MGVRWRYPHPSGAQMFVVIRDLGGTAPKLIAFAPPGHLEMWGCSHPAGAQMFVVMRDLGGTAPKLIAYAPPGHLKMWKCLHLFWVIGTREPPEGVSHVARGPRPREWDKKQKCAPEGCGSCVNYFPETLRVFLNCPSEFTFYAGIRRLM